MTFGRCSTLALLVVTLSTVTLAQDSFGIAYKYARLPNPLETLPGGINNKNVVSGSFYDDARQLHGFIYKNRVLRTVDFPGAAFTEGFGVNDNDVLVGDYFPADRLQVHGFIFAHNTFITIDPPGSLGTFPRDINNAGTVVGYYNDSDSVTHGFIYSNGTFTTVDAPPAGGTGYTELLGINSSGLIVGGVDAPNGDFQGFWLDGNTFHYLNAPGRTIWGPFDINDHGDIVGVRGYNSFLAFAVPAQGLSNTQFFGQAIYTRAINDARILVGNENGFFRNAALVATPMLTVDVASPQNHSTVTNPVHVAATARGANPVSQFEVWVNRQKIYSVSGGTLDALIDVPVGTNERFVIKAVDSTGAIAKVVDMINVN